MIDVRKYHNVSKQAHALQELERLASEWTDLKSILVMHDSILYECYEDLSKATIWFDGLHYDWLRSNKELITEGKSSRIFRVMMVPYPYIISNNFKRKALMEFIVLNIHMQLWHGIICCVKFFDPRVTPIRNVITKLNIAVFPRIRSLFDFPDYYHAEDFKKNVITKAAFDRRQCCTRSMLLESDNITAPIWLFYEEEHFWPERRESWHWNQMRRFFIELNRLCKCPYCQAPFSSVTPHLDHIGPFSKGHPQTLVNLQLTCKPCNQEKSAFEIPDPLALRFKLSDYLVSNQLDNILKKAPDWLGYVRRPERRISKLVEIAGL